MSTQRTLCIVKPDAVEKGHAGAILAHAQKAGFRILGMKQLRLGRIQAEGFYAVHAQRPFFVELCTFMTRGPVVVAALEREGAVEKWREVIGSTDPAKAAEGTIRKLYGSDVGENAVHGSDSDENGRREVAYFFAESELC